MSKGFPKSKIKGTGLYLPKEVRTNYDLEQFVETNDEWIFERTGIRERRICSTRGGEWPSDMAFHATVDILQKGGYEPNIIDMILFATLTPDFKLPNTACVLQEKLGITNKCAALDISAACSGFIYGLSLADCLIKTAMANNILVIGSEMLSREINWNDRNTCVLFGDGCGACLVGRNEEDDDSEILAKCLNADGKGANLFSQPVGGAVDPVSQEHLQRQSHFMTMKGKEMFKVATRTLAESAQAVVGKANLTLEDVSWFIPHQANARIIETTGKLLNFPSEKVIMNIEKYANTSAATVPIAFHEAIEQGKIKRGDLVLLDAFGAGLTSGAVLLRY